MDGRYRQHLALLVFAITAVVDVSAQDSCTVTPINPTTLTAAGGVLPIGTENVMIRCNCSDVNGTKIAIVRWFDSNENRPPRFGSNNYIPGAPHFTRVGNDNCNVILVIPTLNDSYDGNYTCGRRIPGNNSLQLPTTTVSLTIGVPTPNVTLSPSGPIQGAMVGSPQVITCTVSTVSGVESSSVVISWMGSGGGSIMNDSRVTISPVTSSGNNFTSSLQFTYLMEGDEGNYTCNVTIFETSVSQSVELQPLTSNIPLEITTDPEDMATSQETFVVTFTCEATGDPPISYQWFHNDVEIPSTNTTTYRIIFVGYNNFGSYHCSATSGSDEVVSNSATLTVSPGGSVSTIPYDISTSFGSSETLYCLAQGGPNNTFEWTNNQGQVVSNSAQLQFQSITGSDGGVYTCTVTNAAGSDDASSTITVAPYNATITTQETGNDVIYTCTADGGPSNTFEWTQSSDNSQVSTSSMLTLDRRNLTNSDTYICTIENSAGNTSTMITLDVISQPDDVTICEGRAAMFTCVLNSNIRSDEVQWYRFIKDTNTTEMVDPNGENINFLTHTNGSTTNSSLTITNAIKSYTGYFWVGIPSLNVCNASLTILTSPSALKVNTVKNIGNSSIDIQWDVVDDFPNTTYTVTWTDGRDDIQVATLIEQTSYTITGLTLDTVYNITVTAANRCGSVTAANRC